MTGVAAFAAAPLALTTPVVLFHVAWSTLLDIFVGSLPGLTATMGVALLTTLTYTLDRDSAILVLIRTCVGAIYGESCSAILLNIPGTPASAAIALDGLPLARAGYAMGLATAGSAIGTLVGIVLQVVLAPPLAEAALRFGSFGFLWLALFGVVISGQLAGGASPLKGCFAGLVGLMVAMIGADGIHSHVRLTGGSDVLNGGIGLIPAMVGALGFAEVVSVMWQAVPKMAAGRDGGLPSLPRLVDLWRYRVTIPRSGIIGMPVGIIPGVGEDIGAWASYAAARRSSPERDGFGRGSAEGLTAAETGNGAVVPGALIPAPTLAVPGSAPAAVLIAALIIHGIRRDDHDRGADLDLYRRRHACPGDAGDPGLRAGADAALHPGAADPSGLAHAGGLHPLRDRALRADAAALRRLGDGRLRPHRVRHAADEVSDGAAGARHHPGRPSGQVAAPGADPGGREILPVFARTISAAFAALIAVSILLPIPAARTGLAARNPFERGWT